MATIYTSEGKRYFQQDGKHWEITDKWLLKMLKGERVTLGEDVMLMCLDCGTPYRELGLDLMLPDEQWLMIHPGGEGGILCASCMMIRAERLDGATVVLAKIDVD